MRRLVSSESAFLRIGRLRSAVATVLSIAVAALLALVPAPGFELQARSGSAFSAWTSDPCLAAPDRHADARRALPRTKPARHTPLPDLLATAADASRFAGAGTVAASAQPLAPFYPPHRPSTRRARAPPSA